MEPRRSEVIVLRSLPYGEDDLVVTFFCREGGLLRGFAPHGRKSRKRFGATLSPFAGILLQWSAAKGSLVRMKEAELLDLRAELRTSLPALALAGYGCELVGKILPHEEGSPEIYGLLRAYLDSLCRQGPRIETRMLFELRLLKLCGYEPHLLHCSRCLEGFSGAQARFDASCGGSLCGACAAEGQGMAVSAGTLGSLSRCLATPLEAFEGFRFGPLTLAEGSALLADCVRSHLHGALKSLGFLERVMPQPQGGGSRSNSP